MHQPPLLSTVTAAVAAFTSIHYHTLDGCCGGSGAYIRYIVLYAVLGTYLSAAVLFYWGSTIEDEPQVSENKPLLAEEKA